MRMNYAQIATLVKRAKKQDGDAFTALYELTYQNVYCLSYGILKDTEEARDATQEVYIKVFQNLDGLVDEFKFIAWINKIAYHTCLRIAEKPQVSILDAADLSGVAAASSADPAVAVVTQERISALYELMDDLDPMLRSTVMLKYLNGLKLSEIAAVMDCPEGTVKSRLNTAKRKLNERLQRHEKKGGVFMGLLLFDPLKKFMLNVAPSLQMDAEAAKAVLCSALEGGDLPLSAGEHFAPQTVYQLHPFSPAQVVGGVATVLAVAAMGTGVASWLLAAPSFLSVNVPSALTRAPVEVTAVVQLPEAGLEQFYAVAPDGTRVYGHWDGGKVFRVPLPENGAYQLYVVSNNQKQAVQQVEVTTIDRDGPMLDGYTAQNGVLTLHLSDTLSGVDYSTIYGVTDSGLRVTPTEKDADTGTVRFSDPGQDFQICVSDQLGNVSWHQVTRYEQK